MNLNIFSDLRKSGLVPGESLSLSTNINSVLEKNQIYHTIFYLLRQFSIVINTAAIYGISTSSNYIKTFLSRPLFETYIISFLP